MPRTIRGELQGDGLRVAVLVARWNVEVTDRRLSGALAALSKAGVADDDVTVVEVPGAFELPAAASAAAKSGRCDAIVALGCVLKGETDHDRHIARACAHGLVDVSIEAGIPVGFGVITADTLAQAMARSEAGRGGGGKGGHKGIEAAEAAVRLARTIAALSRPRRPRRRR